MTSKTYKMVSETYKTFSVTYKMVSETQRTTFKPNIFIPSPDNYRDPHPLSYGTIRKRNRTHCKRDTIRH